MSRVSKAIRKIRLGGIVTTLVKLAEKLLGGGTGSLKKKLVMAIISVIIKHAKEAGKDVPENVEEMADELVEQTVTLLNENGTLKGETAEEVVAPAPATVTRSRKPRTRLALGSKPLDAVEDPVELVNDDDEEPEE